MAKFDTWESYLYPVPDNQTLRNLFGERDPDVLAQIEYMETADRQREIEIGDVVIPRTYDAEHLRAIHRHLFQDVYEWAREYRTVNMAKNLSSFADARTNPPHGSYSIHRYLEDVHQLVANTQWNSLSQNEFAASAATVFVYLNQAHPFREGNGRALKVFMEHVAEQSRFTLDFGRVSREVWNNRSMLSGPNPGAYEPEPDLMVPVFKAVAVARSPIKRERNRRSEVRERISGEISRRTRERLDRQRRQQPYRGASEIVVSGSGRHIDLAKARGPGSLLELVHIAMLAFQALHISQESLLADDP